MLDSKSKVEADHFYKKISFGRITKVIRVYRLLAFNIQLDDNLQVQGYRIKRFTFYFNMAFELDSQKNSN